MRKPVVMGNWKLNGTKSTVTDLIKAFTGVANANEKVDVAICAPAIFIGMVESLATGSKLQWGSEDVDVHTSGAFTGENSPVMIKEFGSKYAIVGHSERRGYHNESNEVVAAKFKAAQDNGLVPVLCIGESEAEYDAGKTLDVCQAEIKAVIDLCGIEAFKNAIIAYEPIWAIGTGKTATPEIAQNVHAGIRAFLKTFNAEVADGVRILYGGSCNAKTAPELFAQKDIDGGLIGGASLKVADFTAIIEAATANA
ncbi:MAG: triose-phosphate isomerase [Succinivibrio dextrinosolvens]|jgi:triosephosphate isomerase|uniref:Triosephosphate isomerase n=1 Tax=Succinivibrio dextrinosolvens TaxID=83771 RepID=A0A662ZCT3_9GAMM|nr:triose-phosphate isomerase [Succinivibrio dextrinosolvens]MBQ3883649.1 triose-phosphate isomerase [Succinivibrio sp.]MDY6416689.1 triose-phosphate isomerase [Succinivibrio dextrinosolvens]MDY6465293.1 triose-phosphate isomerase [Succinivibrio dextrinosolvens]MDY6471388.1 triose-phosphate isomerase [Succinivibrio dextrinosolvens]SFK26119.1 triosephosphate isomerase [Succinivibrio dextrinosolvens]